MIYGQSRTLTEPVPLCLLRRHFPHLMGESSVPTIKPKDICRGRRFPTTRNTDYEHHLGFVCREGACSFRFYAPKPIKGNATIHSKCETKGFTPQLLSILYYLLSIIYYLLSKLFVWFFPNGRITERHAGRSLQIWRCFVAMGFGVVEWR